MQTPGFLGGNCGFWTCGGRTGGSQTGNGVSGGPRSSDDSRALGSPAGGRSVGHRGNGESHDGRVTGRRSVWRRQPAASAGKTNAKGLGPLTPPVRGFEPDRHPLCLRPNVLISLRDDSRFLIHYRIDNHSVRFVHGSPHESALIWVDLRGFAWIRRGYGADSESSRFRPHGWWEGGLKTDRSIHIASSRATIGGRRRLDGSGGEIPTRC